MVFSSGIVVLCVCVCVCVCVYVCVCVCVVCVQVYSICVWWLVTLFILCTHVRECRAVISC